MLNEYPAHVRKEMYRRLKRLALMAQGDPCNDHEGEYILSTLVEYCDEQLEEME